MERDGSVDGSERCAGADGSVPALAELCCQAVAAQLLRLPCTLDHLPPRARQRILRHAIASGALEEEHLPLFGGLSELVLKGSKVTDKGLEHVAAACGARLLALDLSQCVRLLSDAGVAALLRACPKLQALDLSHCRLTDVSIEAAAQHCPALTALDYSWNGSGVGDRSARAVAAHSRRLESLRLCGSRVTDAALLALACACPRLHTLEVRGCHLLSEAGFVAVVSRLPRLAALRPSQWRHFSDASVDLLVRCCGQLTALDLSMCDRIDDAAVGRAARGLPQLRTLQCYGVGRLSTPHLASASLTHLCLSGCRALSSPSP